MPTRERGGASMPCERCKTPTRVLRTTLKGKHVLRHRVCLNCGKETHSVEIDHKVFARKMKRSIAIQIVRKVLDGTDREREKAQEIAQEIYEASRYANQFSATQD